MQARFLGLFLGGLVVAGVATAEPRKSVITTTTTNTNTATEVEHTEVETKNFNVRVNPLNLLFTLINVDVDFKLHDKFTVGPTLGVSLLGASANTNASFFILGVRGNIYLTSTAISSGFYLGPAVSVWLGNASSKAGTLGASASVTAIVAGANVGYQWVAPSGFNVTFGLGASYFSFPNYVATSGTQTLDFSGLTGLLPSLELDLGFAF